VSRLLTFARENGWAHLFGRATIIPFRRLRSTLLSRKLHAPNFCVGGSPRLLGLSHIHIGPNFSAGDALWLEAVTHFAGQSHNPTLTIGANVNFSDSVHIGSRVLISDHSHGIYRGPNQSSPDIPPNLRPLHSSAPIVIGSNVWIGDGVAILPSSVIGDGAVIGANSVVTGTVPANTIALGSPARPIRQWNPATSSWEAVPTQ